MILQQVPGLGALDEDRAGHDVRAVRRRGRATGSRRSRSRPRAPRCRGTPCAREVPQRVLALVLEDPLVADGVDRHGLPRPDAEHRGIRLARQSPPQHRLGRRAQVVVAGDVPAARLQDLDVGRHVPIQLHHSTPRADSRRPRGLSAELRRLACAALGHVVDRLPVQPRAADLAGQHLVVVCGDRVLVQQAGGVDRVRVIDAEDREVRGGAGLDHSRAAQAGDRGGAGREQRNDRLERDAAGPRLGPYCRQPDLQTGDPAPGEAEVSAARALQVDGATASDRSRSHRSCRRRCPPTGDRGSTRRGSAGSI